MNFSSVVSYHTNPLTCGVAKFSAELAKRLGVPFVGLWEIGKWGAFPLFSIKWSEFPDSLYFQPSGRYGVFWHDGGDQSVYQNSRPEVEFYADPSLGSPGLWCPSLITPRKRPIRLFSFGMAHKLQTDKYRRVRELLDAASIRYHLRVSVGLHEGTSLDGAEKHFDALKEIMGPENVTILGILSDDAVSEELADAEYVLAFFEKGVRANNTTVHAALSYRKTVITNFDNDSPGALRGLARNVEFDWLDRPWGSWFSWDRLLEAMRKECEKSESRIA